MAGDVQQQQSWKCLEGEPDHYFAITIAINILIDGKYLVSGEKKEKGKGDEYLETENIWSAEEMKEKGEGNAHEAGTRAKAIITKPK